MQPRTISRIKGKAFTASPVYLLLTLSGLSFCFLMGFPFDNHNESYLWLAIFSKVGFWDTLTKNVTHIESFRPLGMANAWLSYKLTGNIYLQQILNWLFALSSFTLLFTVVRNKILFSVLSFVVCACFFSGYIYLFHLHGVFYGPFQLYVASLTCIAYTRQKLSGKMLALAATATVIASLYHTFALLVFCAFLTGYIIQLVKTREKAQLIRLVIVLVLTLILARLILQAKEIKTLEQLADGFFTSYRMAEINITLSFIAVVLSIITAAGFMKKPTLKIAIGVAIIFLSALLMYMHMPVLVVWIALCCIKMIIEKNWVMASLIASTAILPLGSSSGSPTYIVFVLMICTFVTASTAALYIPDTVFFKRSALLSVIILFCCLAAIKVGYQIPLLTAVVQPILAEQEKTHQLKDIIGWKLQNKEYMPFSLKLYDAAGIPVNSENSSLNRINRPVTDQRDINAYMDAFSNDAPHYAPNETKPAAVYITFGNKMIEDKQLVFSVEGKWNGKACVFQ